MRKVFGIGRFTMGLISLLWLTFATLPAAGSGSALAPGQETPGQAASPVQAEETPGPPGEELDSLYLGFRALLQRELMARDVTRPDDLYKFLFQAVMGPGHAVSEEGALGWLESEWQGLPAVSAGAAGPDSPTSGKAAWPLLQPLRPDGQLVRVHLLPLRNLVGTGVPPSELEPVFSLARERLAIAFARTAADWLTERGLLRGLWVRVVEDQPLWQERFAVKEMDDFTAEVERNGWPAVHHSEEFRFRWAPHYRVVASALLPPAWRLAAEEQATLRPAVQSGEGP